MVRRMLYRKIKTADASPALRTATSRKPRNAQKESSTTNHQQSQLPDERAIFHTPILIGRYSVRSSSSDAQLRMVRSTRSFLTESRETWNVEPMGRGNRRVDWLETSRCTYIGASRPSASMYHRFEPKPKSIHSPLCRTSSFP